MQEKLENLLAENYYLINNDIGIGFKTFVKLYLIFHSLMILPVRLIIGATFFCQRIKINFFKIVLDGELSEFDKMCNLHFQKLAYQEK